MAKRKTKQLEAKLSVTFKAVGSPKQDGFTANVEEEGQGSAYG